MATPAVEDYVKAIYLLQRESPTGEATVARIAATLGVTKGTVTAMIRKLREARLADAIRYGGISLTASGNKLAIDVIRRHRLIEVFLVETLGFDWAEVHDEAERLEHAMSSKVLDRLNEFLGNPAIDPHGDPIPDANGKIAEPDATPLANLEQGQCATIARITDQDPQFLAFAADHGLKPGSNVTVTARTAAADAITIKPARHDPVSLSLQTAASIHVHPAKTPPPRRKTPRNKT